MSVVKPWWKYYHRKRRRSEVSPLTIFGSATELWARADLGITIATGASVWADQSGKGRDLIQGTAARQPGFNATDANFNGHPSLTFDDVDDFMLSDDAASTWDFMSDGSGCTIMVVHRVGGGGLIISTATATGADNGITTNWNHTVGNVTEVGVEDGTNSQKIRTALLTDVEAISIARYRSGGAGNMSLRINGSDGSEVLVGDGDPVNAGAGHTLAIGSIVDTAPVSTIGGEIVEIAIASVFASAAQVDELEAYVARYGL